MAHFIQQLLNAKEPLFSHGLKSIEKSTGNAAIDVRLIGEIHEKSFAVMRKLGLDPRDTTRDELWAALRGRIPKDTFSRSAYCGVIVSGSLMSFNEQDVKANRKLEFKDRTNESMRQALAQELVKRYKKTGRITKDQVEEWLEDSGIKIVDSNNNQEGKTK